MKAYFRENLAFLRNRKGVSQNSLDESVGVNSFAINQYESSNAYPSPTVLLAICEYFQVSVDDMLKKELRLEAYSQESQLGITDINGNTAWIAISEDLTLEQRVEALERHVFNVF